MQVIIHQIGKSFLIKKAHFGYGVIGLEIDGKFHLHGATNADCYLDKKPKKIRIVSEHSVPSHYVNATNARKRMSVERFDAEVARLREGFDGEYWRSLDEEYAYKKFTAEWRRIDKKEKRYTDAEVIVYDITGRTENPHITPLRFLGKEPVKEGRVLYEYKPDLLAMLHDAAKKLKLVWVEDESSFKDGPKMLEGKWTYSVPKHGINGLRYLKVGGQYVQDVFPQGVSGLTGTWEECIGRYNDHMAFINRALKYGISKLGAGPLSDSAAVVNTLEKIRAQIMAIVPMKKSVPTKSLAMRLTAELINDILNAK